MTLALRNGTVLWDAGVFLTEHFDVPPSGIGAMTYSTPSLPIQDLAALPNPIEKRRTFTPQRRATQKWPNS